MTTSDARKPPVAKAKFHYAGSLGHFKASRHADFRMMLHRFHRLRESGRMWRESRVAKMRFSRRKLMPGNGILDSVFDMEDKPIYVSMCYGIARDAVRAAK